MGDWQTQRDRRQTREQAREDARRLKIEWADKFWLAQNHVCADSVLVWLSENRAEASKIGSSRWNLETLPSLVVAQQQLRKAETFEALLAKAEVHHQTVTVADVLAGSPQVQPVGNTKTPRRNKGRRQASRKRPTPAG